MRVTPPYLVDSLVAGQASACQSERSLDSSSLRFCVEIDAPPPYSIRGRPFHVIDDNHLDGPLRRLQPQSELIRERTQN